MLILHFDPRHRARVWYFDLSQNAQILWSPAEVQHFFIGFFASLGSKGSMESFGWNMVINTAEIRAFRIIPEFQTSQFSEWPDFWLCHWELLPDKQDQLSQLQYKLDFNLIVTKHSYCPLVCMTFEVVLKWKDQFTKGNWEDNGWKGITMSRDKPLPIYPSPNLQHCSMLGSSTLHSEA